jgi:hypothetical protein
MASPSYHTCPFCGNSVDGQPARIVGEDQSGWPGIPPVSVRAHHACIPANFGCIVVRPGQTFADVLAAQPARYTQSTIAWQGAI